MFPLERIQLVSFARSPGISNDSLACLINRLDPEDLGFGKWIQLGKELYSAVECIHRWRAVSYDAIHFHRYAVCIPVRNNSFKRIV